MIRRIFWLAVGIGVGTTVTRRVARARAQLSPQAVAGSLQNTLAAAIAAVRDFVADMRESASDREHELREGAGIDGKLGAKPEDFARR
ncbi:MAG: hypothetical protein ACR2FF_00225 [Mycobacteriales bacterium]|nr:MAG: hypothetical protein DLM56_13805 [Pseudonocardiales bacterium]